MKVVLLFVVLLTVGCKWVKETEAGKNVALVKPAHAAYCELLGTTVARVKDSVGFIERGERKIADELIALAKNEAARLGGDSIIAKSGVSEGAQTFSIYKCEE